jgi:REP element-mobilizing transposase RayT
VLREHGHQQPDPKRKAAAQALMSEEPIYFDEEQRRVVEETITRHCAVRGWTLHIVRCRTNHVHVVVTAERDPDIVMDQFKAWCTRRLKELQAARDGPKAQLRQHWWTEKGSTRWLNKDDDLNQAIIYVRDFQ